MNDEIKEILDDLKDEECYYANIDGRFHIDLNKDEASLLLDYITNLQESEAYYYGQYKDYKSRCEKAVEYINENWGHWCSDHCTHATETTNILNGRSDE